MIVLVLSLVVWLGVLAYVVWSWRADQRLLRHMEKLDRERSR